MNVRRGLIRIWIIITLTIAIVTGLLIYEPLIAWMRLKGTIGLEISQNDASNEIRIGAGFDNLSADEKFPTVMRAMYLLGLKSDDLNKCGALQTELSAKLRDAQAARDNETSELISKVLNDLRRESYSSLGFKLQPWEKYLLKKKYPEYSDMEVSDFSEKIEKTITDCRPLSVGSVQLGEKLERLAKAAFKASRESIERQLKPPMVITGILLAIFWSILLAGFWVASGFRSKRN